MKKLICIPILFALFSCTPKSTQEQNDNYNTCKKTILENKDFFLAKAKSEEGRKLLQDYCDKVEKNNLDELISNLDIEQEQINILISSVCIQAEELKNLEFIKKELLRTDSLLKDLDSKQ